MPLFTGGGCPAAVRFVPLRGRRFFQAGYRHKPYFRGAAKSTRN
jgi:hypothetical protein